MPDVRQLIISHTATRPLGIVISRRWFAQTGPRDLEKNPSPSKGDGLREMLNFNIAILVPPLRVTKCAFSRTRGRFLHVIQLQRRAMQDVMATHEGVGRSPKVRRGEAIRPVSDWHDDIYYKRVIEGL